MMYPLDSKRILSAYVLLLDTVLGNCRAFFFSLINFRAVLGNYLSMEQSLFLETKNFNSNGKTKPERTNVKH